MFIVSIRYEKQYMEEAKLKEEQNKDDKSKQTSIDGDPHSPGVMVTKQKSLTSKSSSAEQDLDTFLLGDLEDGDGGAGKTFLESACVHFLLTKKV